ncbi:MAG: hypothetical protein JW870_10125 [Candidatus Delongbacteria bacterium]|nr:hypothetical protein [Candidatus Delongbacteria bacterium]
MESMIKIPIENFSLPSGLKFDYFICSSSFEERCLSFSTVVPKDLIDNVIICHFENNYEISEERLNQLTDLFHEKNPIVEILKKHQPIHNFDAFWKRIDSFKKNSNVAIDITTFTRENLLMILRIAFLMKGSFHFSFFYTSSEHYSSNDSTTDIWLSKGVKDIRSVFSFPGDFSPLKKIALIILTGFEAERAQTLIDIYEPSKLILGKANKLNSINPELARINEANFENLKMMNPDAVSFEFSCIILEETIKILKEQILWFNEEYNIVIAPMNNKLSSLAVGLVALEDSSVQICYASTNQYNIKAYSSSSNYVYRIEMNEFFDHF